MDRNASVQCLHSTWTEAVLQDFGTSKSPKVGLEVNTWLWVHVKVASAVASMGWPICKLFGRIASAYQNNTRTPLPSFAIDLRQNPKSFKPHKIFLTMVLKAPTDSDRCVVFWTPQIPRITHAHPGTKQLTESTRCQALH